MDFITVQNQLEDLPPTFLRPDVTFAQLMDAFAAAFSRYTVGADGVTAQLDINAARYGWLDVQGLLLGYPRRNNEADVTYLNRITYSIRAAGGPPLAIVFWILNVWGILVTVTENFPAVGYQITFPPLVTQAQIDQILLDIAHVRPAGVPFTSFISNVGTYLDTVNYLGAPRITGAYLGGGRSSVPNDLGAATNNSPPLLPSILMTDPTLNPTP